METEPSSNPIMINDEFLERIDENLRPDDGSGANLGSTLKWIYNDYIRPNIFAIMVFCLLALFLFIRYLLKKASDEQKRKNKRRKRNRKRRSGYYEEEGEYETPYHDRRRIDEIRHRAELDAQEFDDDFTINDEDLEDMTTDTSRNRSGDDQSDFIEHEGVKSPTPIGQMDRMAERTFALTQDNVGDNNNQNADIIAYNS